MAVLLTNLLAATTMQNNPVVTIETTEGTITIALRPDIAPKACENFIGLSKKGYYNDVIFHRVIKNFMIQGGDPTGTGRGGESLWGKNFEDECTPKVKFDKPGLLAMANRGPATNGSQFFIMHDSVELPKNYVIFGKVVEGMDVVDAIATAPVAMGRSGERSRPLSPVRIERAEVLE